ncbi:hypothetical protein CAOG_01704 [Capsaspora owczarzaki ATCC 30864]|uniref:RhoGEF domain containing protein n=1 Tax=Capsaspora owczarzaki (strain ATCC 30864) TaxID=595528 RepID=A0A0D2WJS8_CAPO3|nr:hypothetical protein CAOG_01704 [Capsaspora owczarzaki ATCC 30864]KJE90385.1 hypothetical protein CAOG_001704 [Capsaspora owczarzaki ATCC 30864]|eukprot:XP_004364572.2 hypothetical protein CAOG_01704 [Capsaspora owczarzaki ATCC 30864]
MADVFLFRELAQVNILSNVGGGLVWQPASDSLCYIGVMEEPATAATEAYLRLVAQADGDKVIVDCKIAEDMSMKKASDCFVTWRDANGATVGFNFVQASHADALGTFYQDLKDGKTVSAILIAHGRQPSVAPTAASLPEPPVAATAAAATAAAAAAPAAAPAATPTTSAPAATAKVPPPTAPKRASVLVETPPSAQTKQPQPAAEPASSTGRGAKPSNLTLTTPAQHAAAAGGSAAPSPNPDAAATPLDPNAVLKLGFLEERRMTAAKAQVTPLFKGSKKFLCMLRGARLLCYKVEEKDALNETTPPNHILLLDHCVVNLDTVDASRREASFTISTGDGQLCSFSSESVKEINEWINAIHLAAGLHLTKATDRIRAVETLRTSIHDISQKVDAEEKRGKGPEFNISFYMDDLTKEATNQRIRMNERIIETLSLDLYRLRCYEAAFTAQPLPLPSTLLNSISKPTHQTVMRIAAVTPVLLHAYNSVESGLYNNVAAATAAAEAEYQPGASSSSGKSSLPTSRSIQRMSSFTAPAAAPAATPTGPGTITPTATSAGGDGKFVSIGSSSSIAKLIRGEIQRSSSVDLPSPTSSDPSIGSPVPARVSGGLATTQSATSFLAPVNPSDETSAGEVAQGKRARSPSLSKPGPKTSGQTFIKAILSFAKEKTTLPISPETKVFDFLETISKKRKIDSNDLFLKYVDAKGKVVEPPLTALIVSFNTMEVEVCKKYTRSIELVKDAKDSFGLFIKIADIGLKAKVPTISRLAPGGAAIRSEQLFANDELWEVNGIDVRTKSLDFIMALMKDNAKITLQVRSKQPVASTAPASGSGSSSNLLGNISAAKRIALTDEQIKQLVFPPPVTRQLDFEQQMIKAMVIPSVPAASATIKVALASSQSAAAPLASLETDTDPEVVVAALQRTVSELSQLITRVANAGKKAKMSKAEMRDNVVMEIINTERKYLADLNQMIDMYLEPLKSATVLSAPEIFTVECNTYKIRSFHTKFLADLEASLEFERQEQLFEGESLKPCYGDVFQDHMEGFKLYADYCSNHPRAAEVLSVLHDGDQNLADFLAQCNPSNEQSLKLDSFLIKPIQRILKYPLLMRELLKFSNMDDENSKPSGDNGKPAPKEGEVVKTPLAGPDPRALALTKAMAGMIEVANMINERKRRQETVDQATHLRGDEWDGPEISELGEVLHCGEIMRIDPNESTTKKKDVELFLFSKAVLFARNKNKGKKGMKPAYRYFGQVPIKSMLIRSLQDTEEDRNIWELVDMGSLKQGKPSRTNYLMYSKSPEDKKTWMQLIKQEITANIRLGENKESSTPPIATPLNVPLSHQRGGSESSETGSIGSAGGGALSSMVSANAAAWMAMSGGGMSASGAAATGNAGSNGSLDTTGSTEGGNQIRRSDSFNEAMDDRLVGAKAPKKETAASAFGTLPRRFLKK